MNVHPVVMAGGSGTRFWPLSRRSRPKQFLPLAGGVPLLRATVERLPPLARIDQVLVVCGPSHAPAVRRMLPRLPKRNVVVEPCPRNTAPCVGLAALHVAARDPAAVMVMLPADHPSRAETGYGYLKLGAPLVAKGRVKKGLAPFAVERFVEKPDAATATRYLADGGYLWNSGIFAFRADVILEEIRRLLPELAHGLAEIAAVIDTPRYGRTLARAFPGCPSISIDYGVMEKADRIAVVPGDFGWSDVGSFAALPEVRELDANGNVVEGEALIFDGRDNVVLARPDRPIAVIGLDGVVVVDGGDALLVCRRERAQDVRKAVDELARRGREDVL